MYRKKRIPTVTLERHILHYLLGNKAVLQGQFSSCRQGWFTSEPRSCLFSLIERSYSDSRTPMSDAQFEYLLEACYPGDDNDVKRQEIKAEYEMVKSMSPQDEATIIIGRLNEAMLAEETEDLIISAFESLEKGDVEEALSRLKQGSLELRRTDDSTRVVSLWEETADWVQEVCNRRDYPEKYAGIPTGFKRFDDMTGGLFPKELTVVFGLSGKGKSTLMKQIGVNARRAGYNVLHCGNEEDEFQMRTKYTAVETGTKYSHWKRGQFDEVDMKVYENYLEEQKSNGSGELFIYDFPQQTDATMIERQLMELKLQGVKIDLVIVDYLDLMSSIKKAYNENDEGGRVTGDLKQLAKNFDVPVLVATQANTTAEKQELREKPFLSASDVFGTKRKVHSANTLIGIVNQTATVGVGERDASETKRHRLVICVPKNRDGGIFTFRLIIEVETGRVIEDEEDDPAGREQEKLASQIMAESIEMENSERTHDSQSRIGKALEQRAEQLARSIAAGEGVPPQEIPRGMEDITDPFDRAAAESEARKKEPSPEDEPVKETRVVSISSLLRSRRKK